MSKQRLMLLVYLASTIASIMLCFTPTVADLSNSENYRTGAQLVAWTIGCAGNRATSGNVNLLGTMGQASPIGSVHTNQMWLHSGFWPVTCQTNEVSDVPNTIFSGTQMFDNAPNPFNPSTKIAFEIASPSQVRLEVFDLRGRLVRELANEYMQSGRHEIVWDGCDDGGRASASGTYFCRLRTMGYSMTQKMMLVK